MKAILFFILLSVSAIGQVKTDSNGNYFKAKKDTISQTTGKTYTDDKGISYPVYISAKGKLYILRISKKTGKEYKQYLKVS